MAQQIEPNAGVSLVDPAAKEHWKKGNSLFEANSFDEAIKEFTDAISVDKNYADAYFNRALAERVNGKLDEAKKDLEKVMELQPDSPDAPLLYGDIMETKNEMAEALEWYKKSLAINPNYQEAKSRIEHIESLLKINQPSTGPTQESSKQQENVEMIQDGQIKKVSFYKSDMKFDSVIGLKRVKKYLHDNVVLAIERPDLFNKYGKKQGVGLLLYGPPGVGKTYIVNAIAGEANANVIIARINQIVDMYTGNTEKNLHAIFEQARKNSPCIIFFDEMDALGGKRGGGGNDSGNNTMRLAVNQFLVEMNGLEDNPSGLFVIGATNNPWDIDPALKRSGRFSDALYIPPPNYFDRKGLFKFYTKKTIKGRLSFGRLARATMGFAPADIQHICDRAVMLPLLHEYSHNKERKLSNGDIFSIMKEKDFRGSSLDEWYAMVRKDVISKTETQTVNGKKQVTEKEGKLDAQEKVIYKTMIRDIKKNTSSINITIKRIMRFIAVRLF